MVSGQNYRFETARIPSTITENDVYDVLQDRQGFLWIAGSNGLARYDGHEVKELKHFKNIKNSICGNMVYDICEGPDGRIWIATKSGLSVYDPEMEVAQCLFNDGNNISRGDNIITSVIADKFGIIWYATYNGLYRYDPETEERQVFRNDENDPNSISEKLSFTIYEDKKGRLWFGNVVGLSYYENDGSFKFVNYGPDPENAYGLKEKGLFSFCETEDGQLWVGGYAGFYKVEDLGSELKFIHYNHDPQNKNSLSYNYVNKLMADGNDLWVSTWSGGLNKVSFGEKGRATFTHFKYDRDNPYSVKTDEVNATLIDDAGVLWVATASGLLKSAPASNKFGLISAQPNQPNSLISNKVQASLIDSKGNLWIGTENGLNFRSAEYKEAESQFLSFQHEPGNPNSLTHDNIYDLFEDSSGRLWISTYRGLSVADLSSVQKTRSFTNIRFEKYPHNWVFDVLESKPNEFWLSTYGKMARINFPTGASKPAIEIFDMNPEDPNALSNATTYQTCKDAKGRIWVGTYYGLSRINEEKQEVTFTNFYQNRDEPGSLSDVTINCLFLDSKGRFWVGTRNGMNLVKEDKEGNTSFLTFDESTGFPNSTINFIEEDEMGKLWVGTADGLVHFDPEKALIDENAVIKIYTEQDGLGKNNMSLRSSSRDEAGNIYFGSNGLNYFNPKTLISNQKEPKVVFTGLKVLNEVVQPEENGIISSSISTSNAVINLNHDDNMVELFFSSLDYTNPVKNRYRYRMEGVNTDWVKSGNKNSATYTNLSAGQYNFQVMGSNNDGVWNEKAISLRINVSPHWSKSRTTYFVYVLIAALLLALFYRWRKVRALEKIRIVKEIEIARLEERENLRKKNAADFHDELGHRLTKIALFLEIAGKQANGDSKLQEYINKVKTNTKSLSDGLKDLIWSLDPKKDTLLDTVNRIQEAGDNMFDYSEINFSTNAVDPRYSEIKLNPTARKHILLIFKEAMNNALKYSRADKCIFQSRVEDGMAYFTFKDNGVGFDLENVANGNGLGNMRERVEELGGNMEVSTSPNNGTAITAVVPINGNKQ